MKKYSVIFWITTIIIVIFEGVIPAFTSQTELAKEGIRHLGYPEYFGTLLMVFKVAGAAALIIPAIPKRVKEWAYAGFAIDFISAFSSLVIVDGLAPLALLPLAFLGLLIASYVSYHKIRG
ncbi:MAG: DoxX family protein [Patescibacteria group bacterium]